MASFELTARKLIIAAGFACALAIVVAAFGDPNPYPAPRTLAMVDYAFCSRPDQSAHDFSLTCAPDRGVPGSGLPSEQQLSGEGSSHTGSHR
jgi:hypothetical protein